MDRLDGVGVGVGLGFVQKIGGQVDDVVGGGRGAGGGHGALRRQSDARIGGGGGGAGKAVTFGGAEDRIRFQRQNLGRAQGERLVDAKPPGGAGEQDVGAWVEQVGQRGEGGRRVACVDRARFGQGGDAVAVAIQAKSGGRAGQVEQARIVGNVGVDAFGEIVEQRVEAARRADGGERAAAGHVQRGVDGFEIVVCGAAVEQQQGFAAGEAEHGGGDGGKAEARGRQGGEGEGDEQRGHQGKRVQHAHQQQHQQSAGARTGHVGRRR